MLCHHLCALQLLCLVCLNLFVALFRIARGRSGEPAAGAAGLCKETVPGSSEIFTREYSKAVVQMDCRKWEGTVTMK
jgi:hypothetical protein